MPTRMMCWGSWVVEGPKGFNACSMGMHRSSEAPGAALCPAGAGAVIGTLTSKSAAANIVTFIWCSLPILSPSAGEKVGPLALSSGLS